MKFVRHRVKNIKIAVEPYKNKITLNIAIITPEAKAKINLLLNTFSINICNLFFCNVRPELISD